MPETMAACDADVTPETRPYFWAAYFQNALEQIQDDTAMRWRPDDEIRARVAQIAEDALDAYAASAYLADRRAARRALGLPVEVM